MGIMRSNPHITRPIQKTLPYNTNTSISNFKYFMAKGNNRERKEVKKPKKNKK